MSFTLMGRSLKIYQKICQPTENTLPVLGYASCLSAETMEAGAQRTSQRLKFPETEVKP